MSLLILGREKRLRTLSIHSPLLPGNLVCVRTERILTQASEQSKTLHPHAACVITQLCQLLHDAPLSDHVHVYSTFNEAKLRFHLWPGFHFCSANLQIFVTNSLHVHRLYPHTCTPLSPLHVHPPVSPTRARPCQRVSWVAAGWSELIRPAPQTEGIGDAAVAPAAQRSPN